jgi:chaperonin GroEL
MDDVRILFGEEARQRILRGVTTLRDAVRGTLGPRARTVMIQQPGGTPLVINSGVVVARAIHLPDPFEDMGVRLVREVALRTSEVAGDGTTTATLIAAALITEGLKHLAAGASSTALRRGIDRTVAHVVTALHDMATPCETPTAIAQVAALSANNDTTVGDLVARAMARVGREGVITVEDGSGLASELDLVEGMRIDRGYLSPYFVTVAERQTAVLEDVRILLCDHALESVGELLPLLERAAQDARPLLVIAEDIRAEALATLVVNHLRGVLKACAVKAPGFGEQRRHLLGDMAVLLGGTVISREAGISLEKAGPELLGRARRVIVERDSCTLVGGAGSPGALAERTAQLKVELDKAGSEYARAQLRERIAHLSGGVAVIKVGAATEAELKERRARIEDAVHATRAAVAEGVLPGGGVALLRARARCSEPGFADEDERLGVLTTLRALEEPLRQIVQNADLDPSLAVNRVCAGSGSYGLDASSGTWGDLMAMGVLDPCKVTRTALQNAASIAGLILTTDCLLASAPDTARPD